MQVSVEKISNIKRLMEISVPAETVDQQVSERLQKIMKTAKISGYRPGKAPLMIIKQRYGSAVRQEVVADLMRTHYGQALQQEKIQPASYPAMHPKQDLAGQPLTFSAEFEIYPEISLADCSTFEVTRPQAEVSDSDIDDMIIKVQKQNHVWETVDRPAAAGDQLILDYEGKIDGTVFSGGSAEKATLELGSGQFIEGFESGLEGVSAGESKTLNLQFPESYHHKEYAGKEVIFEVTVHEVQAEKLPEVNDALAEQLGIKEGGVAALRENLAKHMKRELNQTISKQIKNQVMDQLVASHDFELPSALVDGEISHMQKQMREQFSQQFGSDKLPELPAEHFEDEAKKRVKLGLVISEIIKEKKLAASPEAVQAHIQELAEPYEDSEQMIAWYQSNQEKKAEVEAMVLEQVVVDWVLDQAHVDDQNMSYQEAIYWHKEVPESEQKD